MVHTVIPCPSCHGHGRVAIFLDPYHRLYDCPECDGTGEAHCQWRGCNDLACDAIVDAQGSNTPLCSRHMIAWKAEEDADADATD